MAQLVALAGIDLVLTSALLITPAATASLLTHRLRSMMIVATLVAIGASMIGLYASYYASVSSGAAIVLICTLCFIVAWLGRRRS